jgi:hypothetical protein
VKTWTFPARKVPGRTVIVYPIAFKPKGAGAPTAPAAPAAEEPPAAGGAENSGARPPGAAATEPDVGTRLDEVMRVYDRGDYHGARELALTILRDHPDNTRMMRIMVSTSCAMGDEASAREYHARLPARDQRQMQQRCSRYGVALQ